MSTSTNHSRRAALKLMGAAALTAMSNTPAHSAVPALIARTIPRSGESLPVIGLGTWQTFDVPTNAPAAADLREVLKIFVAGGGKLVDSSPMYGRAEGTVGELAGELALRSSLFLATKVWTNGRQAGITQMQASLRRLRAPRIELMQVHNLLDLAKHMQTLREWKENGTIRYLGITHYHAGAHRDLEKLIRTRSYDFVQFNYSLAEREAEARLFAAAADSGTAVIINRPFATGELFARVKGKELPAWAAEFDCGSWAQFFLKFIVAQPEVTCVIPGTGKPHHMTDNLKAGAGRLPDAQQRRRMVDLIQGY